jgi:hypothetical protein
VHRWKLYDGGWIEYVNRRQSTNAEDDIFESLAETVYEDAYQYQD